MTLVVLPAHAPGQRIGLFGGSFDPPHDGHLAVSLVALARLRLDRIWWLVTPGNPLKENPAADLDARVAAAKRLARHPRIVVTDVEAAIGTTRTVDTLSALTALAPAVRFVWLMGADNLATFHRWRGWQEIAGIVPIAVIDRPGYTLRAKNAPAARALARFRLPERDAAALADRRPPAWLFLHGLRHFGSSTALRAAGRSP